MLEKWTAIFQRNGFPIRLRKTRNLMRCNAVSREQTFHGESRTLGFPRKRRSKSPLVQDTGNTLPKEEVQQRSTFVETSGQRTPYY